MTSVPPRRSFFEAWQEQLEIQRAYNAQMNARLESGMYGGTMTEDAKIGSVVKQEMKVAKPKQTGMALEMDVIKKIAFQLSRLPAGESGDRVLAFVQRSIQEQKIAALKALEPNGQTGMFP